MKKKDVKFVIILILLLVAYIVVEVTKPPVVNWSITYDENHKIPYGTFAMNHLLPDVFEGHQIEHSNSTLYDLGQRGVGFKNLVIICNSFQLGEEDGDVLVEMLKNGRHVFVAAGWFAGKFFDSLKISASHSMVRRLGAIKDTVQIRMADDTPFTEKGPFKYLPSHASEFFYGYDSARAEIFAVNNQMDPVLIRYSYGDGALILSTLPMAFTNYYLLRDRNAHFVSNTFSLMPLGDVHFTNYYHYGRMEPLSKLRFVLTQPALKWAYYIVISSLVIFMVFGSKRRQRAIPVIRPPANTTLDFIDTMGNLYFNKGNNKNIAGKRIAYFLDHLRQRYFLKTDTLDDAFARKLAMKTNKKSDETLDLINLIKEVAHKKRLSDKELVDLNNKIEDYYN